MKNPLLRPWQELKNRHRNAPAFIMGNGVSKKFYNPTMLYNYGIMVGCNLGFRYHYCDYLCFRDEGMVIPCCREYTGTILTHDRMWPEDKMRAMRDSTAALYGVKDNGQTYEEFMAQQSTGMMAAELAYHMGCNPLILIGCDCCFLNGYDRDTACDEYKEDCRTLHEPYRKMFERFEYYLQSKDVKMFKLGSMGAVGINHIEIGDIIEWGKYR